MHGLLWTVITRPIQRLMILGAIGTLVAATAFASNRDQHARLDGADLALEKARILLGAPVCTSTGQRDTEACDKVLRRAMERLNRARSMVEATGEVSLPRK